MVNVIIYFIIYDQHLTFRRMMLKWKIASDYANYLVNHSKWSKTIYVYTEAACLMELGHLSSLEERKRSADLVM